MKSFSFRFLHALKLVAWRQYLNIHGHAFSHYNIQQMVCNIYLQKLQKFLPGWRPTGSLNPGLWQCTSSQPSITQPVLVLSSKSSSLWPNSWCLAHFFSSCSIVPCPAILWQCSALLPVRSEKWWERQVDQVKIYKIWFCTNSMGSEQLTWHIQSIA